MAVIERAPRPLVRGEKVALDRARADTRELLETGSPGTSVFAPA